MNRYTVHLLQPAPAPTTWPDLQTTAAESTSNTGSDRGCLSFSPMANRPSLSPMANHGSDEDKLELLLFQSSGFYGGILDSFVGLSSLKSLDLSQNNLLGVVPNLLGSSFKNLVSFDVSQNKLQGSYPDGICNGKDLISLSLHSNSFTGTIPNTINECLNLERFQVQNNGFSGRL